MNDITVEEKKVVDELRRRTLNDVTPKMLEDISLFYRFAKARDFNLLEAEAMLRKNISWRKQWQMDTILTDYKPPEVLVKYAPSTLIGLDKRGSIVRHVDCGRADAKGLWNLVKKTEVTKYCFYILEKDKDMLIKEGRNLGQPLYSPIYDFEDLSYANAANLKTLKYLPFTMRLFADHYPETIGRAFIINVPVYFAWIYSLLKQCLPNTIIEKFRIYDTDAYKEDLLKIINDAAELPACYGGTKTDPDGNPLCENLLHRGCPVPRSYYSSEGNKKLHLSSDAEKLSVKPFSKEEVTFNVKEENSLLKWEFEIKNRDICFSLLFREESSEDFEPVEIIPQQRIDASDEPQKGCLKCEKTGSYTMVFDNTNTWLHTKEIYFRAEIKGPKNV